MQHFIRASKRYTDLARWPGWLLRVLLLGLLLWPPKVVAQQDSSLALWAEFVEDDAGLLDNIYYFLENPLNVNIAVKDDLLQLPFLTAQQADSIISYRRIHQRIRRKKELKKIVGAVTYRLIKDFLILKSPPPQTLRIIHRIAYPFDPAAAYIDGSYDGSPLSDYNKIYLKLNRNLRAGLITQKDGGESSFADYVNGFLAYQKNGWQIILGKYYPQFGEGLIFSNPFGGLKSAKSLAAFGGGFNCAHPSVSSYENGGMFGLFLQTPPLKGFILGVLSGNNFRDARYGADGRTVIGFDYEGYHRNAGEIAGKNAIREQVAGLTLDKTINTHLRIAALFSRFIYAPEIRYTPQTILQNEYRRNIYKFSGKSLTVSALAYDFSWQSVSLKGEAAKSNPGGYAVAQALLWRRHPLGLGVKIWRASRDFHSPYGRLFDDTQPFPQAEQGIYLAASLQPEKRIEINAYHIFKKDLWRSYFSDLPQWQREWLLQSSVKGGSARLVLRIRRKEAPLKTTPGPTESAEQGKQWLYRVQALFPVNRRLRWSMRWQHTSLTPQPESGSYLFQNIQFRLNKRFSFSLRLTVFRTASYRSRLYEYERDLPGSFANYALYGEGYKWYALVGYMVNPNLRMWIKYRYLRQSRKDLVEKSFNRQGALIRLLRVQLQVLF